MGIQEGYPRWRGPNTCGIWKHPMLRVFSLAFIFFLLAISLAAQTSSTIEGIVKDKQGATIAAARIQVINSELAIDRATMTDSDGNYRVAALPPGNYEVRADKEGFQSEVIKGLELTLNRTLTFDISL